MTRGLWLGRTVAMWPILVAVQGRGDGHVDGCGRVTHSWGGSIVMWVLLLVVIGVLIYSLTQNLQPKQTLDTSEDTQLETLKKRYARGEITKDEFEEMKQSL